MKETAFFIDLGEEVPYKKAWEIQHTLHSLRVEDIIPDTLIFVEHSHVFTFGRKGKRENLLVSSDFLGSHGIELFNIERGGDITYHGPGQLVGYPIFHLKKTLAGLRPYVWSLEEVLIRTLKEFNVDASRIEELRGVWVGEEKIGAIGIAVKRWVTFHGFAFNVSTNLEYFDMIVPCGIRDKGVTSLSHLLKREVSLDEVKPIVLKEFEEVFGKTFKRVPGEEALWKREQLQSPSG